MASESRTRPIGPILRRLSFAWLALLLLGAVELGASFLPLGAAFRPLLVLPALAMIAVVGFAFMEVDRGPVIVRGFAVAALFWLLVLLALGSADPLTRTDYDVPGPGGKAGEVTKSGASGG